MKNATEKIDRALLLSKKQVHWWLHPCDQKNRSRLFVAGMQRSGTNMLMNVLEESLATDVFHERDPCAFHDYQMREYPVIQGLVDQSPGMRFRYQSTLRTPRSDWTNDSFPTGKDNLDRTPL